MGNMVGVVFECGEQCRGSMVRVGNKEVVVW